MNSPIIDIPFIVNNSENYMYFNNESIINNNINNDFILLNDICNEQNKTIIHINKSCSLKLIKSNCNIKNIIIKVSSDLEVNLFDVCLENNTNDVILDIYCENNSIVKYTSIQNTLNELKYDINFYVNENVNLDINTLNLNDKKVNNCTNVYMNGLFSNLVVNNSTINNTGLNQIYDYKIYHNNKDTTSKLINYVICKNESVLNINSNGIIKKDCARSKINQKSKGIILDLKSAISANPLLQIDEFDVEANHGASIGAIDDEDLYYLMSRGLTKSQSEQLIVSGYMEPIIKNINNEEIKNYAINLISEKLK